jgi:protein-L-isoaspartate(D-aspartate) O-methyltransferase
MVARQIAARGIRDRRTLAAMAAIPRHRFVPQTLADAAHDDAPLPVGTARRSRSRTWSRS